MIKGRLRGTDRGRAGDGAATLTISFLKEEEQKERKSVNVGC